MKLAIAAAAAALLAFPALAQSPAVQGRTGSSAGGYRTDAPNPATGGPYVDAPGATGSIGSGLGTAGDQPGATGGISSQTGTTVLPPQNSSRAAGGAVVPSR